MSVCRSLRSSAARHVFKVAVGSSDDTSVAGSVHELHLQLLSTVGDRAFPVATARIWNNLLQHVTSRPSFLVLRSCLKTHLFTISYPSPLPCTVPVQCKLPFGHCKHSYYLLTHLLTFNWLIE